MSALDKLLRDLVTANHILAREGVTDSLGHISVRHPDRPERFFLSCSRSPESMSRKSTPFASRSAWSLW